MAQFPKPLAPPAPQRQSSGACAMSVDPNLRANAGGLWTPNPLPWQIRNNRIFNPNMKLRAASESPSRRISAPDVRTKQLFPPNNTVEENYEF